MTERERRKFSRVFFRIETLINYNGSIIKGTVDNISLSGMFIKIDEKISQGETINFTISLAGVSSNLILKLCGKVVRITPEGVGVLFKKMDLESFIHLRNIVAYNGENSEKVIDEFLNYVKENFDDRPYES